MISVLVTVGVLATYVTGNFQLSSEVTPDGTFVWTYGFPLPWVKIVGAYCNSPLTSLGAYNAYYDSALLACLKYPLTTSYDWILFAGDVLFYFGLGYGLILAVRKTWNDAMNLRKKQIEESQRAGQTKRSLSYTGP